MSSFKDANDPQSGAPTGRPSLIERALELARSGEHRNKSFIIQALKREGYDKPDAMLHGLTMGRQLREAIAQAQVRIAQGDASKGDDLPTKAGS